MTNTERLQFAKWRQGVHAERAFRMRSGAESNLGLNLNSPPKPVVFQVATGPSPIQMLLAGAALVAAGLVFTRSNM